jgi:hypothetical protein
MSTFWVVWWVCAAVTWLWLMNAYPRILWRTRVALVLFCCVFWWTFPGALFYGLVRELWKEE